MRTDRYTTSSTRLFALALPLAACAAPAPRVSGPDPSAGITTDRLLPIIQTLASDEFEGRAPGTRGEKKTVAYLTERFQALGLEPGNQDGTYAQSVPLRGIKSEPAVYFTKGDTTLPLELPGDFVALSRRPDGMTIDESDVVFVGYGVRSPEWRWDDYKGADLRGKTLLMLVGDPPVPDRKNPSLLDEKTFKGRAMTYYGRWTYKYEIASAVGAAAAI